MTTETTRGLRATGAALAAAALVVLGLSTPAVAAVLIDPDAEGSITIHKFQTPNIPTGLPNDGTEIDGSGLTPIAGIEFTVNQVDVIDLSTNSGWEDAVDLSALFDPADAVGSITGAGYTLGADLVEVTQADGTAVFDELPVGLYLVRETDFSGQDPAVVTPAAPFLISVPLTDPDDLDNWIYDVHAYPKNPVADVDKTVLDAGAVALGDAVVWTITADIPNEDATAFRINDDLDARLDYVSTAVSLTGGTPALVLGTDYSLTPAAAQAGGPEVVVTFLPDGLLKLTANPDKQVIVEITTTANAIGEIANQALIYPNQAAIDDPAPLTAGGVESKWGAFTIEKLDEEGDPLPGAVFSIFASEADALAETNPIELGGQTTFPADASGLVTFSGLRYTDFADGEDTVLADGAPAYRTYWVVEVQAPAGYELLAQPLEIVVDEVSTPVGVDLQVENVPSNAGFSLPFTGGSGAMWVYALSIGGFAIALTLFLVLGRRRRNRA